MGMSVNWLLSVLYVCVCDIKSEYQQKNVLDLSNLDTLLHETYQGPKARYV